MPTRIRALRAVGATALLVFAAMTTQAAVVFNYGTVETGGTPGGAPPWLRATFTQLNPTTVDLLLEAVNLTSTEFVSEWWFNVNPTILPTSLSFAFQSGTAGPWNSLTAAQDGITNAGGVFDFDLGWPTSGMQGGALRFTDDETALIRITRIGGLLESDFNWTSGGSGDAANVLALAHIQAITSPPGSSKVSPTVNGGGSVPEPGSLALVGIAALAAALLRRKRGE